MPKYCPKCSKMGKGDPPEGYEHLKTVEMDRRNIHPMFYLTDGMGLALKWTEDNRPVIYRCPECGYTEMYIGER